MRIIKSTKPEVSTIPAIRQSVTIRIASIRVYRWIGLACPNHQSAGGRIGWIAGLQVRYTHTPTLILVEIL
jgi:hypothetical protein